MRNPKTILAKNVGVPVYNFIQNYCSREALTGFCHKIANFIYDHSHETAIIMLVFNAISVMSSHLAQIGGLIKRSSKEDNNYLITQEWQELGLDLILTIIPPFILNNFLMKKFDSGQWTTKFAKEELTKVIGPRLKVKPENLYSTQHIKSLKESIIDIAWRLLSYMRNSKKVPVAIKNRARRMNVKPHNIKKISHEYTLENITTKFDALYEKDCGKYYNGKSYDEISGQRNGYLLMAAIGYTILASNIVMPILKNLLANRSYKKRLEKMGETPESIKRKKRFKYTEKPIIEDPPESVFNIFSNYDNSTSIIEKPNIKEQPAEDYININDTFKAFETFNKISSKSSGLRI